MKDTQGKIVVTGGAGFIGSNLIKALNKEEIKNIIVVDHLKHNQSKKKNLLGLKYEDYFDRDEFMELIKQNAVSRITAIIHLGARTDTTEKDKKFLIENNTMYSQELFNFCVDNNIRFIYASSGATYGDGSNGYSDDERNLKPLNYYGLSKYLFDEWVIDNSKKPPQCVGLKFFNVYGPSEYHKGFMASVVYHGFSEIKKEGKIKLFKSYKKEYKDGEQQRDFVYIKDVVDIILFFLNNKEISGIYNVGTGKARTFLDLAYALFKAVGSKPKIDFIDMPQKLKARYQYHTEANTNNLRKVGYRKDFYELEDGILDYVKNYLMYI